MSTVLNETSHLTPGSAGSIDQSPLPGHEYAESHDHHILIVDDEETVRTLFASYLGETYTCETAANAQEASRPETNRPEASRAEANRNPEPARSQEAVRTVGVSPVRPLPPPIAVATPPAEGNNAGSSSANPPYTASIRNDDPNRPTPPAEIPSQPPLDLRAAANEAATARDRAKAVAQDMLSAAKSMFHTVLPQ